MFHVTGGGWFNFSTSRLLNLQHLVDNTLPKIKPAHTSGQPVAQHIQRPGEGYHPPKFLFWDTFEAGEAGNHVTTPPSPDFNAKFKEKLLQLFKTQVQKGNESINTFSCRIMLD